MESEFFVSYVKEVQRGYQGGGGLGVWKTDQYILWYRDTKGGPEGVGRGSVDPGRRRRMKRNTKGRDERVRPKRFDSG